ncbi:CsgG/HfaB family protein [Spirochaetota bacterium]
MKRYLCISFTVFLFCFAKVQNVAVLDFTGKNVSALDASAISDYFRSELVSLHAFNVIDRNNMKKVLEEQEFQASGCTDAECALEIGKLLNVQYMFMGVLSKFADNYILSIDQVNIETGRIGHSEKGESEDMNEVLAIAKRIAYKFSDKKINKALPKEMKNAKCPEGNKNTTVENLGFIESYDDIAEVNYSFAICRITSLDKPYWEIYIRAGEAHISARIDAKRAQVEAQKAKKKKKKYFEWGKVVKPTKYDARRVELRFYQKKGIVTDIELVLVTRDKERKAKEEKRLKVKWPWDAPLPE